MITSSRIKNLAIVVALICSLLSFAPTPAQAASREVVCGAGTYTITDGVASAGTDCTGSLVFANDVTEIAREGFRNSAITSLTLPPNLQTIRYAAFYETSQYQTLVIPNSVTLIENQAFEQGQFTSLTLGNGLTSIGDQVFYRNYGIRINSITFGTGLTSIGYAAFQNFGVDRVTIPEGVTTISGRAFDSNSTKVLVLPNSLTSLASDAFVGGDFSIVKYCGSNTAVTSYTFNVLITCGAIVDFDPNLGSGSMNPQTSSTNTTLRTNTFTRTGYVFQGWNTQSNGLGTTYLTSDSFPFSTSPDKTLYAKWLPICDGSTPCSVGDTGPGGGVIFYVAPSLFDCGPTLSNKCKYLEYARTTGTNPWTDVNIAWSGETSTALSTTSDAIGTGYKNTLAMVNQAGGGSTSDRAGTATRAYRGPNNLTDWYLPSIDELDELRAQSNFFGDVFGVFDWRDSPGGIQYWSSTESSSRAAFFMDNMAQDNEAYKEDLSSYVRPIRAFGSRNFINCGTSGTFTIANNIVTGNNACRGTVTIPTGVTSIANGAFNNNSQITRVRISNTVQGIGLEAFQNTPLLTTVDFDAGSTLTQINGAAFASTGITSIELPDSVVYLSPYLFYNSTALTSIKLPSNINTIVEYLFLSATSLTTVTLPESVTIIDIGVFKDATSLSSLTIPSGVTEIYPDAFLNTPALTSYTYCGTLVSSADLDAAGLTGKTRNSCAAPVVYVPPAPVPFLKTLTPPQMKLKDNKLMCTAGTYQTGQTLEGVIQTSTVAAFTPSTYTFSLLINGVEQTSSTTIIPSSSASWPQSAAQPGSTATCAVKVSINSLTNTDKSSDNTSGLSAEFSKRNDSISAANVQYTSTQLKNSTAYQKALIDNRTTWRTSVDNSRVSYFSELDRIAALGKVKEARALKSAALKLYITSQKQAASSYVASKPAALAAKDAANKEAALSREAAIAKANATYGTFIESIGYGVLIP